AARPSQGGGDQEGQQRGTRDDASPTGGEEERGARGGCRVHGGTSLLADESPPELAPGAADGSAKAGSGVLGGTTPTLSDQEGGRAGAGSDCQGIESRPGLLKPKMGRTGEHQARATVALPKVGAVLPEVGEGAAVARPGAMLSGDGGSK
ncbi:unnamed protein product, partial [Discosporangium mesarthrocarpum]